MKTLSLKKDTLIIGLAVIFMVAFTIGYLSGAMRAAKSAEVITYTEAGYKIEYDLIGVHNYN